MYRDANVNRAWCFQGDRFGGALDAAAKQFSKAFDSGMLPMEFVNKMKKDGKLIMGIGHRVKSVGDVTWAATRTRTHTRTKTRK